MERRAKICVECLLGAAMWFATGCGGARLDRTAVAAKARGTVLIIVDTLRADHLSCYGYGRETSPHLDALAAEGTRFGYCISQSSWTKPSTASMLTGLYPSEHGATQVKARLPESVETLAERLTAAGVRTGGFYANHYASKKHGLHQGFGVYEQFGPEEPTASAIVDRALAFLDSLGQESYFCYLHLVDPHAPYFPAAPFDTLFDSGYSGAVQGDFALDNPEHDFRQLTSEDLQHLLDLYDGSIAQADHEIGRFLDAMRERGLFEDALLIVVADHGEEFRDHGGFRHNGKLFNEVVQVPLVIKFPGTAAALSGRVHETLVQQIDLAPTIMASMGLEPDAGWFGRDLRALVRSAESSASAAAFGVIEVDTNGVFRKAVVGAGLKYVRAWSPVEEEFLYDLVVDPGETHNLMPSSPERAKLHRTILERFLLDNQKGISLLIQNGGAEPIEVEISALTRQAFPRAWPFYTEEHKAFGELRDERPQFKAFEVNGEPRMGVRVRIHVAPGDGDGLRLEPVPGESELEWIVFIDGQPADPALLRIGEGFGAGGALPHVVQLPAKEAYRASMFEAQSDLGGDAYRIRIWSAQKGPGIQELELTEDEEAAFRALGYLGGDEE